MNRDPFGLGQLLYGFAPAPVSPAEPGALLAMGGQFMTLIPAGHEGCSISSFCRNPLHPGPCAGWKKKLGVEAPGALHAIEEARKAKVAAKRVATGEAKSAASKALTGRQLASPLHAKKALTKKANQLLGHDDAKAAGKADKVILNKTEIKKYSKIKAAQMNTLRTKQGLGEDPGLEDRLAEALAMDNKGGKDDHYQAEIANSSWHLGVQLAEKHCKKGDGDCDGKAYENLRDQLVAGTKTALLTGDDSGLDQTLADYQAGKLDVKPPPPPTTLPPPSAPPEPGATPKATPGKSGTAPANKTVGGLSDEQLVNGVKMHGAEKGLGKEAAAELKRRGLTPDGKPEPAKTGGVPKAGVVDSVKAAEWKPTPGQQQYLDAGTDAAKVAALTAMSKDDLAGLPPVHRKEAKDFLTISGEDALYKQLFGDEPQDPELAKLADAVKAAKGTPAKPEPVTQQDIGTAVDKMLNGDWEGAQGAIDAIKAKQAATAPPAKKVKKPSAAQAKIAEHQKLTAADIDAMSADQKSALRADLEKLAKNADAQVAYDAKTMLHEKFPGYGYGKPLAVQNPDSPNVQLADKGMQFGLGLKAFIAGNKTLGSKAAQKSFADKIQSQLDGSPDHKDMTKQGAATLASALTEKTTAVSMAKPYVSLTKGEKSAVKLKLAEEIQQGLEGGDAPTPMLDAMKAGLTGGNDYNFPAVKAAQATVTDLIKQDAAVKLGVDPNAPAHVVAAHVLWGPDSPTGQIGTKLQVLDKMTAEEFADLPLTLREEIKTWLEERAGAFDNGLADPHLNNPSYTEAVGLQAKLGLPVHQGEGAAPAPDVSDVSQPPNVTTLKEMLHNLGTGAASADVADAYEALTAVEKTWLTPGEHRKAEAAVKRADAAPAGPDLTLFDGASDQTKTDLLHQLDADAFKKLPAADRTKIEKFLNNEEQSYFTGSDSHNDVMGLKAKFGLPATPAPFQLPPEPATPAVPTPAAPGSPVDVSSWKKVGGQGGSNLGGMYEAPDGTRYYVKSLKSQAHAKNEVLAASLYHAAGIDVPEVQHGTGHPDGWKNVVVSKVVPGNKTASGLKNPGAFQVAAQDGYAVDAWLANYDTVGLSYDNIVDSNGKPVRIDVGGSLEYRAQGQKKTDWNDDPSIALAGLKDPGKNPQAAAVFGQMSPFQEKDSAANLLNVSDEQIDQLVKDAGMPPSMAATLKARKKAILDKYGLGGAVEGQPEPDVLQQLLDGTYKPDLHEMFGPDGNPDHQQVVEAINGMTKADWDGLSASEKSTLIAHVADAEGNGEPGADLAAAKIGKLFTGADANAPSTPAAPKPIVSTSPDAKKASDYATGVLSGTAKQKLTAYEKLSGDEFQALTPTEQKLILADLDAIGAKFLDPKKKKQAKDQKDYLSGYTGGAPASTPAPATPATPATNEQKLEAAGVLLGDMINVVGEAPDPVKAVSAGMKILKGAQTNGTYDTLAKEFGNFQAAIGMKALDKKHGGGLDPAAIKEIEGVLAEDITKKLHADPGPTPVYDAWLKAMQTGTEGDAQALADAAVGFGGPPLSTAPTHPAASKVDENMAKGSAVMAFHDAWNQDPPAGTVSPGKAAVEALSDGIGAPKHQAWAKTTSEQLAATTLAKTYLDMGFTADQITSIPAPVMQKALATLTADYNKSLLKVTAYNGGKPAEYLHQAAAEVNVAADGVALANGWAPDSNTIKEYKQLVFQAKLENLPELFPATPSASSAPSAPAGPTPVGTGTGISHIPLDTQQEILSNLKGLPTGKYLKDPKEQVYGNLLALASAHGTAAEPMSVMQVLQSIDNAFSKQLNVANSNKWENEFADWTASPEGKAFLAGNPQPDFNLVKKFKNEYDYQGIATDLAELAKKVKLQPGPGEFDANLSSDAFKVIQKAKANSIGKQMLADQHGEFTAAQLAGVKVYTGHSYTTMNPWLRGESNTLSQHYKDAIAKTQDAMRPLPEHVLLHRGVYWNALPEGVDSFAAAKKLVGETLMDEAFMSSSVGGNPGLGAGRPVIYEIEAPKGTQAAWVDGQQGGSNVSTNSGEREMLLAAGQHFKILGVTQVGSQTHIRMRIVTPNDGHYAAA